MIETTKAPRREVTLPASTLVELLTAARAGGDDALLERGRGAGRLLAERLLAPQDNVSSTRALPSELFWKRIGEIFASRGWGSLTRADAGPGLGELRSADWIEADRTDRAGRCVFTTGVLQGLLQEVSGAPLQVEETECRASGGSACRFRFGSAAALSASRATASTTGF